MVVTGVVVVVVVVGGDTRREGIDDLGLKELGVGHLEWSID